MTKNERIRRYDPLAGVCPADEEAKVKVNKLTDQETYDKVKTHLLAQMERSVEGGVCRYRGPNGTACAVGCLIPDGKYFPGMERESVWDVMQRWPGAIPCDNERLLSLLQRVHDVEDPDEWATELAAVAYFFGLKE